MSFSLHPDTSRGRTLAGPPVASTGLGAASSGPKIRSRLFIKYVALFVAVVAVALLANGGFEVFFYYRGHKAALIRIQHEQAVAAAAKISQFIKEIESQLGWTTQLPWSATWIEQRRFDALRLIHQVPAVSELAEVDSTGKERLRVSRLAMDEIDSGLDLSKEPKFTEAVAHKVYYGPVYFRRASEPYMTLAVAGTRKESGVSIAEVNLKLIWDVVSQIKVGEHGSAYVVGAQGRLIAHPDLSLVLRNTDMSKLAQVQAAQAGQAVADELQGAPNIQGQEVLTASAPVAPLGWTMFVELPVKEAYAPLYAALQRLAIVLLAASLFAVLAGVLLARRMVGPIRALQAGAERIGAGDLVQRISIKTGDELEGLADQFNEMGARLQESYANLEKKVEQRTAELRETLQQQTATSEVLATVTSSGGELEPVFNKMLENATRICGAEFGTMTLYEEGGLRTVALYNAPQAYVDTQLYKVIRPHPESGLSAVERTRQAVHIDDIRTQPPYLQGNLNVRALADLAGARTLVIVPMLKEAELIGTITIFRQEVRPFTEKQTELVANFANQAVIAIENARLLNELRERTRELTESLEQQTATAEVLQVISSSPGELAPVFRKMLENATHVCGANFGTMNLWDGTTFNLVAGHNVPPEFAAWRQNRPIRPHPNAPMAAVVKTHKLAHVADLRTNQAYLAGDPNVVAMVEIAGARTTVVVPMMKEDELIGVISIYRQEVRPFTDKQIALIDNFTKQEVIAIENTRLLKELRQRTDDLTESLEQQTATSEVLETISSSTGELEPVFNKMLENATRVCGASFGVMSLWDGKRYNTVADYNLPPAFKAARQGQGIVPHPLSGLAAVARTHQAAHIHDVREGVGYRAGDQATVQLVDIGGARTAFIAPLLREGNLVGVITIFRQEVKPFTDKQIKLVANFANQAVIAIENARLLNELRKRTQELSQSLDDLRTAQERLIQTEKLASLGQLTAGIAHEIKNPLNFVNNFSALSSELIDELNDMLKAAGLDDKAREETDNLTEMLKSNLERVVQHGKRADSIVKNMLLHSREGSGERRLADINAIVEESLNLAYHGARAEKSGFNITLKRDLDPNAGMIDIYPQEITRVLLNLISNGFYAATKRKKASGDGFEPTLCASTRSLRNEVEIRIRDNGNGIPQEVKEKMFNPFFTTKPVGEGTGLGLSICHDIIVKQHGGKIDVDTRPGVFTEFIITLPRGTAAQMQTGGKK
jgi:signal transduction histidine kinase/methyl-accepting chemotaxis protein